MATTLLIGMFESASDAMQAFEALSQGGFAQDQLGITRRDEGNVPTDFKRALMDRDVSQELADYYDKQYQAGLTLVSVRPDGREQEVLAMLHRYGMLDREQDARAGQEEHEQGNVSNRMQDQAGGQRRGFQMRNTEEAQRLELRAEQLQANKENVQAGEITVHKEIVTEQEHVRVPVSHEEVFIEQHHVVGNQIDKTPIGENETIIVPVSEEQVYFDKVPVVTEEVSFGKQTVEENKHITETVQREEPRIEREDR